MGVYPITRFYDVNTGAELPIDRLAHREAWYEEHIDFTGVRRFRLVTADPHLEIRDTCYCCTCAAEGSLDMACRNHGGLAARPCEAHSQPGSPWPDGEMPESVQEIRRRRELASA